MRFYNYFRSSAAYRVRIALNLKGMTPEREEVHLINNGGEQRRPDYLAKNPQGLVPALELDDGTVLTQSLAIMEYLDAIQPAPRLIPADPVLAAQVRAVALTIACDIHPLNNLRVLNYLKGPLAHSQADIDTWYHHWILEGGLQSVEQMISGGNFCFGDAPTLADICLIPQVYNARRFKVSIEHLPKILRVDAHCETLGSFFAAQPDRA